MLDEIKDGMLWHVPDRYHVVPSRQPYRYYNIVRTDELFIKSASNYFFETVRNGPIFTEAGPLVSAIRRPDEEEYPSNVDRLSARFPVFRDLTIPKDQLHFLLIHKLNYERLRSLFGSSIPEAMFVMVEGLTENPQPSVVQRAIRGKTLFELIHQPAPVEERLLIVQQMQSYIGSLHIDWAFDNFLWSPASATLFYVDSKPTIFRTERMNEVNRRVLMKRFVRQLKPWWRFW